ncbi:phospholipid-transporting ATPase 2-like [Camellia sinensis]|uniref:phospholipid-transporting ATPase 2-like n=1 Tax=Camellia sinensis TaxID=4442 RepID=UPI0010359B17|nr:phospholipid-transporting ATPase 2-like [Camellia sinensis]
MVRRVSLQLSQSFSISEPGVSGTSLLNAVNLIAYNVFYTSIPVSVSLVDKDLSEGTVMHHPQILYYCQAGSYYLREQSVRKGVKLACS